MASFNRVILIGNLTRDVELRQTGSETAVADIGLAVNDRVKRNNEWVEEVTFVDVTLWAATAENAAKYLGKGSSAMVEGRLKLDTWEQDGQKRSKLKVVADRVLFLGGRTENQRPRQDEYSEPAPATEPVTTQQHENIPF